MGQMTRIHRFPWGTADDAQVLIVHFGSKSTPMIAQQLRQIGLRSRVIDAQDVPAVTASPYHPKLVIFSGGDDSVSNENAPTIADRDLALFMQHGDVLGICYGAQLLAVKLGGKVAPAAIPEFGEVQVQVTAPFGVYAGGTVVMNHNDEIVTLPPGGRCSPAPHTVSMRWSARVTCTPCCSIPKSITASTAMPCWRTWRSPWLAARLITLMT